MKLILAVVQPPKLESIRGALERIEVTRLTLCDAQGYGRQRGHDASYRGHEYTATLLRKVAFEIVVNDDFLDRTIDTISQVARTGPEGGHWRRKDLCPAGGAGNPNRGRDARSWGCLTCGNPWGLNQS